MLRAIVSCLVNWNNSIGTSLSPVMAAMPSLASSSSATSSGLSSTDTGTTPCLSHPQLLVRPPCSWPPGTICTPPVAYDGYICCDKLRRGKNKPVRPVLPTKTRMNSINERTIAIVAVRIDINITIIVLVTGIHRVVVVTKLPIIVCLCLCCYWSTKSRCYLFLLCFTFWTLFSCSLLLFWRPVYSDYGWWLLVIAPLAFVQCKGRQRTQDWLIVNRWPDRLGASFVLNQEKDSVQGADRWLHQNQLKLKKKNQSWSKYYLIFGIKSILSNIKFVI